MSFLLSLCIAQGGEGAWRTLETEHFRLHHPVAATAYAEAAVQHLEEARQRTETVVGRTEDRIVDVYIEDPYATVNGMAIAGQRRPVMVLWTTPPEASSMLANHRDPFEYLILHEDLHLVHLLMPARGGSDRVLQGLTGVGPVARKSPRWVSEGYATVVEGQLTGHGRPHGDFRAAFLRVMAEEGRLPAYGALDGSSRWNGGSYAYLVGSAFLEWLLERTDPDALQRLWKRMSAVEGRDFDAAFRGVFGQTPAVLYDRFRVETIAVALDLERSVEPGEVFLDGDVSLTPPALSPDGKRLAMLGPEEEGGSAVLRVYSTAVNEDAQERQSERREEMMERDPEDVPSVEERPAPHEEVARQRIRGAHPRWIDDDTLLVHALYRQGDRYRTDLVRWTIDELPERITRWADLRNAAPAPDGTWAAAVQTDWGRTRIVRVGIPGGGMRPLTEYGLERVVDVPRVSPDGKRIVFLEATPGQPFRPVILNVDGSGRTPIPLPDGLRLADPEWVDATTLAFGVGRQGVYEIVQLDLGSGEWTTLTDTGGRAVHPAFTDDTLYYLRLASDGYDVYATSRDGVRDRGLESLAAWVHTPPLPPTIPPITGTGAVPEARSYGLGRTSFGPIGGVALGPDLRQGELGGRFGDAMGRHEGIVAGVVGRERGLLGGGAMWSWRALPVDLTVHASALRARGTTSSFAGLRAGMARQRTHTSLSTAVGTYTRNLGTELVPGVHGRASVDVGGRAAGLGTTARVERLGTLGGGALEILPRVRLGTPLFALLGSWRHGARGTAVPYVLGGRETSVTLPEVQWRYTGGMAWGQGQALAGGRTVLNDRRVALGGDAAFLELQNVRLDNGEDRLEGTMLSAGVDLALPAQPLLRLPALGIEAGVGCQITVPEDGLRSRPCRSFEHYVSWAALGWRL